jgi:2-polyprenyl-6-methoxyphenol hydroxylase-like FAD-dependent oxidoreductase
MNVDAIIVGGGLGGSGLATLLARKGKKVLVLEREEKFKDRIRGENIHPWGVAVARRIGLVDPLLAGGARSVPFFSVLVMGETVEKRPTPQTTPHGEAGLNMYHPDMQETVLGCAARAGAEVKRGAMVQSVSNRSVTYVENGKTNTVSARLIVGADGRNSNLREWGGFDVERDPNNLRVSGTIVEGTPVPDDSVYLGFGEGFATFIAPHGNKRARLYFVYPGVTGDRKFSGKEKIPAFLDAIRATRIPAAWLDGVTVTGPLAEFEGADHWVPSAAKNGVVLLGDAAGASDPSWGSGQAKTLADIEDLGTRLCESDDWDAAIAAYAKSHDDRRKKLHSITTWMTELYWTPGPAADERRMKVSMAMKQDPTGFPDLVGLGPFGPCDESARRKILALD